MTTLRVRNADLTHALVVRVWHQANAFMSDGDSPWLDEDGAPTSARSHNHSVPPGATLELSMREALAVTVLAAGIGAPPGIVASVRRYFHAGSTDSGADVETAYGAPFSLANMGTTPLRVRVFASATFQLSPLRDFSLAVGEATELATGQDGISVRVE
jgi:hypothetical protein